MTACTHDYGEGLHLGSASTPTERSHYARLVLLYDHKADRMEVCSQDALLQAFPLSTFEVVLLPPDVACPGLYIDVAGDRSFKILDMSVHYDSPGVLLVKDMSWMRESVLCRVARENGGMRSLFVSKGGMPGDLVGGWRRRG